MPRTRQLEKQRHVDPATIYISERRLRSYNKIFIAIYTALTYLREPAEGEAPSKFAAEVFNVA